MYLCPVWLHHLHGEVHCSLVWLVEPQMKHLALPLAASLFELWTLLDLFFELLLPVWNFESPVAVLSASMFSIFLINSGNWSALSLPQELSSLDINFLISL